MKYFWNQTLVASVSVSAMKRARCCSFSWTRRAKNLRFPSGVNLVPHQVDLLKWLLIGTETRNLLERLITCPISKLALWRRVGSENNISVQAFDNVSLAVEVHHKFAQKDSYFDHRIHRLTDHVAHMTSIPNLEHQYFTSSPSTVRRQSPSQRLPA